MHLSYRRIHYTLADCKEMGWLKIYVPGISSLLILFKRYLMYLSSESLGCYFGLWVVQVSNCHTDKETSTKVELLLIAQDSSQMSVIIQLRHRLDHL
jgi:hypothetical protein